MKRQIIIAALAALCITAARADETESKVKTGWNFGALPSISFDADLGFQYGALANIYYYGDGSLYPEYLHSIYVEASYTTKRNGTFRIFYDSKHLIPNHRLSVDVTYMPDAMCDFYGFNGYQSVFQANWRDDSSDAYRTRAFYKYKRDFFRAMANLEGSISGPWKWAGGMGVLGYGIDDVDIDFMNRGKSDSKKLPNTKGLYQKYVDWGLIAQEEKDGGWHPYVQGGIVFDTRDRQSNPNRGIWADAFLTASMAFGDLSDYNNLKLNAAFRHYVPIINNRLTLAYRIGIQNTLLGKAPFYMNTYMNTLYMQRAIYEGLGGGNSLRGVMRNRILADGFAYANVELRAKLVNFDIGKQHFYVGCNPFVDFGIVTQKHALPDVHEMELRMTALPSADGGTTTTAPDALEDYFDYDRIYRPHLAAGLGLKVAMNENFVVSVDWATPFDKQDNYKTSNLYIKIGYLF